MKLSPYRWHSGYVKINADGGLDVVAEDTLYSGTISRADAKKLAEAILSVHGESRQELLEASLDALVWASGSSDFSPGGVAAEGWEKIRPLLDRLRKAIGRSS